MFLKLERTPLLKVCTGESNSSLLSEGIRTVVLLCNKKNIYFEIFPIRSKNELQSNQFTRDIEVVSISRHHQYWKLGSVGAEGIMLGYENDDSSYRILCLSNKRILISRNAKLDENLFPSLKKNSKSHDHSKLMWGKHPSRTEMSLEGNGQTLPVISSHIRVIGPRHPTIYSASISKDNIFPFAQMPKVLLTSVNDCPKTYKKGLISANMVLWASAIRKELQSMNDLKLWDFIDLKTDYKQVGTTWVFRIERNHLN
ncbi:hypothetical protein O181_068154 [Austropuccinia psidii MF-1]|uniref:Retroviral polymerase SH3-like domain-containing protein n=1 Tax=Austropuccinia psidii MF-1 TaxID=1389203 RepID=A0A9Q3EWR2_9BASI|nr:hypothetical protein [Austropuccinia psidii MF-1]